MTPTAGRLHVIAGPMFAGKTEQLITRVTRARLAGRDPLVLSHGLDTRGGEERLHTHSGASTPATMVTSCAEIEDLARRHRPAVLAIDEAQFFGEGLVALVDRLLASGTDVILAGLSVTFDGRPFSPLPELMAVAEQVSKLTAICTLCGQDAAFHIRLLSSTEARADPLGPSAPLVGGSESYAARCRTHRDALREDASRSSG